jgi:precorrin-6B methylase 1
MESKKHLERKQESVEKILFVVALASSLALIFARMNTDEENCQLYTLLQKEFDRMSPEMQRNVIS